MMTKIYKVCSFVFLSLLFYNSIHAQVSKKDFRIKNSNTSQDAKESNGTAKLNVVNKVGDTSTHATIGRSSSNVIWDDTLRSNRGKTANVNSTRDEYRIVTKNNYWKYILTFITGAVLILLVWYFKSRWEKKNLIKVATPMMNTENSEAEFKNQQLIINRLTNENHELRAEIDKLRSIVEKSKITIDQLNGNIMDLSASKSILPESAVIQEQARLLFFPSPLSDGSFRKVDGKPQFLEGASIYRFSLISDNEAKFEFCDESSSVSMALNNRNDLILSVADEMEGSAANAKKILTYKGILGRVILEESKWIVKEKAKIKYV